ncbi:HET-domain-containing protein [Byssothecium circinans]|uniref:HET-domain-containing protein n=1 Tax=Byssothecium circinans TaxID=147558 RepID=A0A6A5TIQ7_9PLEO|nr:HET-domain-containing protein [Byssothecium circinans]
MRLLHLDKEGYISLTEFIGDKIPPYAILSHTWGPDDQEVTFQDLYQAAEERRRAAGLRSRKPKVSDRFLSKSGYEKLQFCMEQAKKNGLKYSWVDTCCIDKSSSAELSEAINSMFRWYREAEKCFVYLDIDSVYHFRPEGEKWGIKLEHNRWFTRGWTLQEMLAPETVEFFTRDGIYIGDRSSIQLDLHEITGIPTDALNGRRLLFDFSVEERLSWAEKRETKRPEDMAYCLLGLFDVQMPLIYGEGRAKATKRLMKEIKALEDERLPLAPTISSTRSPRQNPISGIVQPLAPSTENSSKDGPLTSDDDRGIVQFLKMYYERLCRDPDQLDMLPTLLTGLLSAPKQWARCCQKQDGHHSYAQEVQ